MGKGKKIALIAHDNRKADILEWTRYNRDTLSRHELFATGTTGALLVAELDLEITRFRSGPLGEDQRVGACAESVIDLFKTELIRQRGSWRGLEDVGFATLESVRVVQPPSPPEADRSHSTGRT